jgi:hypothetical protein
MQNLICNLRRTQRGLAVGLPGVLIVALSATALAVPTKSVEGHGHGHAHSFISTCNPKHFPSGGVCRSAGTGELVTVIQGRETSDTTKGSQRMITRFGPLPNAKGARLPSVPVPRGDLGLPAPLGLVALMGAAGVMVLHRRRRAV